MRRVLLCCSFLLLLSGTALNPISSTNTFSNAGEFVWTAMVFDGQSYHGIFLPGEVPSIYLLAGETHILMARDTVVYYWPTDRQYKPDWATMERIITGTVEVLDGRGSIIKKVVSQPYLITNPGRVPGAMTDLYLGKDATGVYEKYVKDRDTYLAQVAQNDQQMADYERKHALNPDDTSLQPPAPVPDFTEFLSPPDSGFVLNLPGGTYHLQLRDDSGQIIQGSERTLYSISPRRTGLGYIVIPETKWTSTESSDEPSQIIYYASGGTTFYLVPVMTKEYNERDYVRMGSPQDTLASADRWMWVEGNPIKGNSLQIRSHNNLIAHVALKGYSVQQTQGSALGYQIVPTGSTGSSPADFEAFKISSISNVAQLTVYLETADGTIIPGSDRTLIGLRSDIPFLGYLIIVLPLAVAAGIQFRRRRFRSRSLKELAILGV
jgi:hypothetical protein